MTKLITEAVALDKHIAGIAKSAKALNTAIQLALSSATLQAVAHGNINPINTMFTTVGKGVRRAAIKEWLVQHAPVVSNDGKDASETPFKFSRDKIAELVETDKPTMEQAVAYAERTLALDWTEAKPENLTPAEFDVLAMLQRVLTQAEGLAKKGAKPKHGDLLGKLQALAAAKSAQEEEVPAPL